jgi:filamin
VKAEIRQVEEGTYTVTYAPEEIGPHTVSVKFAGQEVPSGPFTVNTVPSGNASVVTLTRKYATN